MLRSIIKQSGESTMGTGDTYTKTTEPAGCRLGASICRLAQTIIRWGVHIGACKQRIHSVQRRQCRLTLPSLYQLVPATVVDRKLRKIGFIQLHSMTPAFSSCSCGVFSVSYSKKIREAITSCQRGWSFQRCDSVNYSARGARCLSRQLSRQWRILARRRRRPLTKRASTFMLVPTSTGLLQKPHSPQRHVIRLRVVQT